MITQFFWIIEERIKGTYKKYEYYSQRGNNVRHKSFDKMNEKNRNHKMQCSLTIIGFISLFLSSAGSGEHFCRSYSLLCRFIVANKKKLLVEIESTLHHVSFHSYLVRVLFLWFVSWMSALWLRTTVNACRLSRSISIFCFLMPHSLIYLLHSLILCHVRMHHGERKRICSSTTQGEDIWLTF